MSNAELKQLGRMIREARKASGLTQAEVAEKADTSANYFAQIERGEVNPSYANLQKIAKALGVKLTKIIPS